MTRARDLADYISTGVSNTELDVLDGVTAGTVTASKALVVDANKDIASLRNITATGAITGDVTGNVSGTAATVTGAAQTNITSLGTLTTLTVDEITINADTITATDDFIIDAASDIKLDANGGYINFFDNGTAILSFGNSSTDALIWSRASDRDMIFKGNDGGSVITALTLDMSDGGTAIFNHDVKMGDLQYLLMGDGNDLELVGDGTNGKIAAANGTLTLDSSSTIILDADNGSIALKDGGVQVGSINMTNTDLQFVTEVDNRDMIFTGKDGGSFITALTLDMSDAGSATFNHDIKLGDNGKAIFGAGSDLQIYHDASNSYIQSKTGNLNITTANGAEFAITAANNGAVSLFYDGTSKLTTTANGINVAGDVVVTNDIYVTDQIIHQGDSDTYLQFHNANEFRIVTGGTEMLEVNDIAVQFGAAANLNGNNLTNVEDIYLRDKIFHDGDTDTRIGFATDQIEFETGGSLSLHVNGSGTFVSNGSLKEQYVALSGTTPTCNVDNGGMFSLTMSGNTTFTFSGTDTGYSNGFILQLTGNGGTVTYPSSVRWAGGSAPDAPANGETDILCFVSRDGGSNYYGALAVDAAS